MTGFEGLEVLGRWWRFGEGVDIHDAKAAHEIVPLRSRPRLGIQHVRYRFVASANLKGGVQDLTAPHLPISSIVPVVAHAVAVFGDEHKASHWLATPLALLENRAPSELLNSTLLNSTEGIQRVEEILTRIEHNIFS